MKKEKRPKYDIREKLICRFPCDPQKGLFYQVGGENNLNNYTMREINPRDLKSFLVNGTTKKKKSEHSFWWKMSGEYDGYFGPIEILFWLPDKSSAFVYLTFRDPGEWEDSYFWIPIDNIFTENDMFCDEQITEGSKVIAKIYDNLDKWLWRTGTLCCFCEKDKSICSILLQNEKDLVKIHKSQVFVYPD